MLVMLERKLQRCRRVDADGRLALVFGCAHACCGDDGPVVISDFTKELVAGG